MSRFSASLWGEVKSLIRGSVSLSPAFQKVRKGDEKKLEWTARKTIPVPHVRALPDSDGGRQGGRGAFFGHRRHCEQSNVGGKYVNYFVNLIFALSLVVETLS